MNWWMIVGGLAGVCLVVAFVWVLLCATYDTGYVRGFDAGYRDWKKADRLIHRVREILNELGYPANWQSEVSK